MTVKNAELKITAGQAEQFPHDGKPQIALSGRSNVGKSSLVNGLAGRKSLARVSSEPGKTITVNFYEINGLYYLVDLPGYGYAKRSFRDKKRWTALTDGYFTEYSGSGALKGVIQLIDIRVGPTEDDLMMIDWLESNGYSWFAVATKADKLSVTKKYETLEKLRGRLGVPVIGWSASSGEGKTEILAGIGRMLCEND